jgi:nitroreductase
MTGSIAVPASAGTPEAPTEALRDPMNTLEAISSRRAIKHFDPDHRMDDKEVEQLIGTAMLSPTSFNIQHWRFVVVRDPELRKQIRAAGNDQAQMTDASLLIVMTADVDAWKKDPQRYWVNAPKEVAELLVNWMGPFHEGKPELQRCGRVPRLLKGRQWSWSHHLVRQQ